MKICVLFDGAGLARLGLELAGHCAIKGKALSGVVSSLAQKGMILCQHDGNEATITITEAGYSALESC